MAQNEAPNAPQRAFQFVDPQTGFLTQHGLVHLDQIWRQISAGFAIVPCVITQASPNVLIMTPRLHEEGARTYGDYMCFAGVAAATSTGSVTATLGELASVKVYKDGGATQAGTGDIVSARLYLFLYNSVLDAGNGGLVLK
jgi:hypothetical protein